MIRGYLKVLTMKSLESGPKSGYELIKVISERTGKKPSSGSMYPLLDQLKEKRYVTFKEKDTKKIYSLTKEGKSRLKELMKKKNEMLDKLDEGMKMFCAISEHEQCELINLQKELTKKIRSGELELEEVMFPEAEELKVLLMRMAVNHKIKEHKKELKRILSKANSELKKLK